MARATKCTPQLIASVVAQLRTGLPLIYATQMQGMTADDRSRWARWGAEGKEPYATYCEETARAVAEGVAALYSEVRTEGRSMPDGSEVKDWKARMRLMESIAHEAFAPSSTVVVKAQQTAVDGILDMLRAGISPGAWAEVMHALSEYTGPPDEDDDDARQ